MMKKNIKDLIKHSKSINITGFLLIFLFFFVLFFLFQYFIDIDVIQQFIKKYPFRAPFLLILLKAGTIVIAPLSGAIIYTIAGALFSFRKAFLYLVIGNILGMTGAFYLGRRYGDKIITYVFGKKGDKKAHYLIDRLGTGKGIFIARIVLFPLEDLINYTAGMTKISYRIFIGISAVVTSIWVIPWLFGIDKVLGRIGI